MPVQIFSASLHGLKGLTVKIEVDVGRGFPVFIIVGMVDSAIQESKERIRSAIKNSGAVFPLNRKIINLAPVGVKKRGPAFDLAIAVGILRATNQISTQEFSKTIFLGELGLDGSVHKINGILPLLQHVRNEGFQTVYLPEENYAEAALIANLQLRPVKNLTQLIEHLRSGKTLKISSQQTQINPSTQHQNEITKNFDHIKGQFLAKKALAVAAAGHHHLLFSGPPGIGKTLLAKMLPSLMPPLSTEESLEVTGIYSISGLIDEENKLLTSRPFREIHQTITPIALIGGGSELRPGEISLAHHGILFLDEINEFQTKTLDMLRQPLEDKRIMIQRAKQRTVYPANFLLVGTMNPCRCGYQSSETSEQKSQCFCSEEVRRRYQERISKPFLDRIDLFLQLENVKTHEMKEEKSTDMNAILRNIAAAREIQKNRYANMSWKLNGDIPAEHMDMISHLSPAAQKTFDTMIEHYEISARNIHRIIKIARTLADLHASQRTSEEIQEIDIIEAANFKMR